MMARFKQPADGQRQNPGTQPRRPAAHARHAAPGGRSRVLREPAPRVEAPTRGSRFADASRATAASHSFPALGNTSMRLVAGQVPTSVSTSSPDDAPRPINVDPAVTGSFSTIRDGQGAVVTSQAAAAQTSVGANDDGISVAGSSYSTRQGDSGWELVKGEGDDATVVAQLSGSPVALCLHEGTLFVPENLSDGTWDVICYVVADGSTPAQLLNGDGQPVVGSGELSAAELDGDSLVVTDASGAQTRLALS